MEVTIDSTHKLVCTAFEEAWGERETLDNNMRSALFVSKLAENFAKATDKFPLVQHVDDERKTKSSGEWLLDISIVTMSEAKTPYKNRRSDIVQKIHWAIESEFSTNLKEFCKDFAKLLHVRSDNYLYIAGVNQSDENARREYIKAQYDLAKKLVDEQGINVPFFLVFVPTPGKIANNESGWDRSNRTLGELLSEIRAFQLC